MKGCLYIVSTPIGNLEDITLRALRILKEADFIAVEDTRHSVKLLNYYEIARPMISYWREKEKVKSKVIIDKLNAGYTVALITDAGTPGISDPGEVLIRDAIDEGIEIFPIPGPTSSIAALSVSGLSTRRFTFIGFLSPKTLQRKKDLQLLRVERHTLVFYESPHRILNFLDDLLEVFGDRKIALCHELTKLHEDTKRGTVSDVIDQLQNSKIAGEYVVIVEGFKETGLSIEDALSEIGQLIEGGMRRKEAVEQIASATGISKKILYKESIEGQDISKGGAND
ncbi:MAG: 16S rRNA (cytidine(1402)-2'-O)-methyltransferase [Nitrospirota bacterium]|uniref:Ribosomal RNA small subunit methyltransferase I n=1 Tax=Candidatus Magnetominusculus xianensis TaxID=1748249 RepID=A0ABR5SJY3_9BACT|nr:16S rRNA (cytidine(1402)-2'-O)-methyltransferase [Candidatus Magnetominusculus xianensis]KWT92930.1 ribosomal RNA small subunit methyltransferase I [Candidatus Magnetominusculus xianensis]MBF0402934.1 16S rRNA (cytidine(1402)-2'-O)-methyltransferase [Nitrospirota bacterium]